MPVYKFTFQDPDIYQTQSESHGIKGSKESEALGSLQRSAVPHRPTHVPCHWQFRRPHSLICSVLVIVFLNQSFELLFLDRKSERSRLLSPDR